MESYHNWGSIITGGWHLYTMSNSPEKLLEGIMDYDDHDGYEDHDDHNDDDDDDDHDDHDRSKHRHRRNVTSHHSFSLL